MTAPSSRTVGQIQSFIIRCTGTIWDENLSLNSAPVIWPSFAFSLKPWKTTPLRGGFLPNGRLGNAQAQWKVARVECKREESLFGDYYQKPQSATPSQKKQSTPASDYRTYKWVQGCLVKRDHGRMTPV